ncbi:AbrB family looped-hinge helix DNA binding protein [Rhizobium petrolearium]|uniref:AbrB/MazE/SpoVT family DNA-binding domain-containing protein n=1 Tax=Neorhizobium petrolearium TaxID=515361 RepID=UPI001AE81D71|nr:AbrB/MazE/SpoVT family DNA-binding domain-containing protein [Neorhizobium petrolearium]MBP1846222.1 AbrB family looped-hinge helix DNA binding protein [Neorhizobium petrolearium]
MNREVTLSPKGQVTIPKEMREALNLHPGDHLIYSLVDGEVVLTPKNLDFNDLAGHLGKPPWGQATLEEIEATIVKAGGANAVNTRDDDQAEAAE